MQKGAKKQQFLLIIGLDKLMFYFLKNAGLPFAGKPAIFA